MIQRIQTLFLLVTVGGIATFLGLPVWGKSAAEGVPYIRMNAFTIRHQLNSVQAEIQPVYYLAALAAVAAIIALVTIFKFRDRLLQSALCAVNSIVMTVLLGLVVYQSMYTVGKLVEPEHPGTYEYGFYGLVTAMLGNVIANRFIRRDEKMVRESGRFR